MSTKPPCTPEWAASEAWDIMRARPRPSAVIEAPIKTYSGQQLEHFRIEVLRMDEIRRARLKARTQVLKETGIEPQFLGNDAFTAERLQTATALEILATALRSVSGVETIAGDGRKTTVHGRLFHNAEELETLIHEDELTLLLMQYRAVQKGRGPIVGELSKEEMEEWIVYLAGAKNDHPLSRLTWPALETLCRYAILQVALFRGLIGQESQSEESQNGQESQETRSPTGITSSGLPPVGPGLMSFAPDDGTVPHGADPVEAAIIIESLSREED